MGLLQVLYRDEHLVIINKPDKLLVHRSRISRDHVAALQLVRDETGQYVYPVHRLDRATSGVLIFALDSDTAHALCRLFEDHRIQKEYVCLVRGKTDEKGLIDHPLKNIDNGELQDAVTAYERWGTTTLSFGDGGQSCAYSFVKACPQHGRYHQIRRHLKHISHPLIGDTTYGKGDHNRMFRNSYSIYRLMLHARRLEFIHPVTEQPMDIIAPWPEEFTRLFTLFPGIEARDISDVTPVSKVPMSGTSA